MQINLGLQTSQHKLQPKITILQIYDPLAERREWKNGVRRQKDQKRSTVDD